ncbi:MAG: bifunctional phosphopantothenoylcysteine decarboxylase/phosphopantothenate--cysteine ligase CoaBC [Alphaproteobacteria bacterium]
MAPAAPATSALTMGRVLLIVGGGIAAYKSLDLIRRLRSRGVEVRTILTQSGAEFVTPLSLATLSANPVGRDLFSLTEESDIGHIRLAREADCIVVAPATADFLARMAAGRADDLATACILASHRPPLVAPSMNPMMWENEATRANVSLLRARGVEFVDPGAGDMACGEEGVGRLAEVDILESRIVSALRRSRRLANFEALVTSGPTHESVDSVRYLSNGSSGRQGYAIASALAGASARTRLISGPVALTPPADVEIISVTTAQEMLDACTSLPIPRIAVCVAAVSDWRLSRPFTGKLDKSAGAPSLEMEETPDILARLSVPGPARPDLVIGFAAESGSAEDRLQRGRKKRLAKGCDWMLLNDISAVGQDENEVILISDSDEDPWPRASKREIAERLIDKIGSHFGV